MGQLYHRALKEANQYWRAAGFFSSSALEAIGAPLGEFFYRGGTIRLATSVRLEPDDVAAIESGQTRQQVCEQRLLTQIRDDFRNAVGKGTALLGALLEVNRLELRICVPDDGIGIYHEKVGVFLDATDFVAFSGSSNETRSGLEINYESVDVFTSWSDSDRALNKRRHFELLWEGKAEGVETYHFPEAARLELIRICREAHPEVFLRVSPATDTDHRWRHQDLAVATFLRARRGILEMATGTGKTRTALKIFGRLVDQSVIDTMIVTAEGVDLLDQWAQNVLSVLPQLPVRFRLLRHFGAHHDRQEYLLTPRLTVLLISRSRLDGVLRGMRPAEQGKLLLVHDEVHGLGSPANVLALDGLADAVPYRLGLSATPEREYDAAGNEFIERNVGPVVFTFGLEDAIKRGILCEFDYYPLEYALTAEDKLELQDVYRLASARKAAGTPMTQEEIWMALARVPKRSKAKLPLFAEFLRAMPGVLDRCLIFVEDRAYGALVLEIVHPHQYNFHTYYAQDEKQTLLDFAQGQIECLITCERLSEGIDIKSVRTIVLFSADRARLQTIQRIGRCLRIDPEDPLKRSVVIDFVRMQEPDDRELNTDQQRSEWLRNLSQIREETSHGA